MTIRLRFLISYLSAILITLLSFILIFSLFTYVSLGEVPTIKKFYRILTTQRPLSQDEKESFILMNKLVNKSPSLLEDPLNADVIKTIKDIEKRNLNIVIRKNNNFTYYSDDLVKKSLDAHAPEFDLNNFEPTGTLDNDGRFFHYIKLDFDYIDGTNGSLIILKRESNLLEFFMRWGIWVVIFILTVTMISFWLINRRLSQTIITPLASLDKSTKNVLNDKTIAEYTPLVINSNAVKEVKDLQLSFEKMWLDLTVAQKENYIYEENRKELISNISHDLKTPITSIIGYVEGLIDGVANTDEKRQLYLQTIHTKSLTLNELIDELFLYSTLDVNESHFNFITVNLKSYIEHIFEEFQWDDKVNISLSFPKEELFISIDTQHFNRVITNIIQNSLKFKNHKNPYTQITVVVTTNKNLVSIAISDNGTGIPVKDLDNIFNRFYRVDKARSSKIKGNGLGLSIVKKIVEQHNGNIMITSEVNSGTEIKILVPLVREENI